MIEIEFEGLDGSIFDPISFGLMDLGIHCAWTVPVYLYILNSFDYSVAENDKVLNQQEYKFSRLM